jgi:hypothetical protein
VLNNWFCKNLGDAMLADAALVRLKEQFLSLYQYDRASAQRAVFIRHETAGHLYCQVALYFSPETSALANIVAAEPCAPPSSDDLSLLVGDDSVWASVLPESASDV